MPSKTSKPRSKRSLSPEFRRWKAASACSEQELTDAARALARELGPGDRVLLEGPMGAGKTTFARALLEGVGVEQPPEGSPSFAIAHEYDCAPGRAEGIGAVIHIDFYRIRHEAEIAESGIEAYYWERPKALVVSEWTSMWPELERAVLETSGAAQPGSRVWRVELAFSQGEPSRRELAISVRG